MAKRQGGPTIADVMSFLETKVIEEIYGMRQDISDLRAEVDQLKTDVSHLKSDVGDIKEQLTKLNSRLIALEKRTTEDSDVYAKEVVELRIRVKKLEREVEKIKTRK